MTALIVANWRMDGVAPHASHGCVCLDIASRAPDNRHSFRNLFAVIQKFRQGRREPARKARIVRDLRPILMRKVLVVPASRRSVRIVGRLPLRLTCAQSQIDCQAGHRPRRAGRIVGTIAGPALPGFQRLG